MEQASTLDKVRENLRLQQVYNVFLRYGLDILFERFGRRWRPCATACSAGSGTCPTTWSAPACRSKSA